MVVRRYEHGTFKIDSKRTPQGFLKCDAVIALAENVQTYYLPGGKVRREYRPAAEVFHPDAMASGSNAPVTFTPDTPTGHPPEIPVTRDNARKYTVGMTGDAVKQDGNQLTTNILLYDADAIRAAESGDVAELSCGYYSDLDHTSGVTADGQHYDAIQKNIRINHVAQVRNARAGHAARFHLDASDNAVPEENSMHKITIAGVVYEVSEQVAQAYTKAQEKLDAEAKDAKNRLDSLTAERDTVKAELEKQKARADAAEKARTDSEDPKRIQTLVKERVSIETKGAAVLGRNFVMDGKSAVDIKKECLKKLQPKLILDGKSDVYVEAAFDYTFEQFAAANPAALALVGGPTDPPKPGDPDPTLDAGVNARQKYMREQEEISKKMGQPAAKA